MFWTLWIACSSPPAVEAPAPGPAPTDVEAEVEPIEVHVTIDDVPWQIERGQQMTLSVRDVQRWNQRIMLALQEADVRASVFVTCDRLRPGDGMVEAWDHAGHAVGNHSQSHLPAKDVGSEAFVADVAQCQAELTRRLGKSPRWFRYPYLGYGADATEQARIELGLDRAGLSNAPVTLPTSDWVFVAPYREALASGDEAKQAQLAAGWAAHLVEAVRAGDALAQATSGRSVPQTLLLHANELTAHQLPALLETLRGEGVRFVGLEEALTDEVFRKPVVRFEPGALPWLARVYPDDVPQMSWFSEAEGRLRQQHGTAKEPNTWPTGVPAVVESTEELVRWLRAAGFDGQVRSTSWPVRGHGEPPPADPGGSLKIAKVVDNVHKTAGFFHSYELRCHGDRASIEALSTWASSPKGLNRPSIVVPMASGACVASVLTPDHDFLLQAIVALAGSDTE